MMGVGRQGTALPGLEIHQVLATGAPIQAQARFVAFTQYFQVDTKTTVGRFGAGDGLEHQVQWHALFDGGH
ncbi:hypothetical protein D3C80_1771660 [compost metagenome]